MLFPIPKDYNVIFPILLAAEIVLLIVAVIRRKEMWFALALALGGICGASIRLMDPGSSYMFSGLGRQMFCCLMPWLFGCINIAVLTVRACMASKMECRLPWRKIMYVTLYGGLMLDLFFLFIPLWLS